MRGRSTCSAAITGARQPRQARRVGRSRAVPALAALVTIVLLGGAASCAGGPAGPGAAVAPPGTGPGDPCPAAPVRVVVSVDQWSDMVRELGGGCARVTTVLADAATDPHDFEPATADIAAFGLAQLAVVNGGGYDPWATKALATSSDPPAVVDAAGVVGVPEGGNPHVWYSPHALDVVAAAITSRLQQLLPGAATYLEERARSWDASMQPYRDALARTRAAASGRTYAATEGVFDEMAAALGLRDLTPSGYRAAAAGDSDPAPGDVHELQQLLEQGRVDVLIHNAQTEGAIPDQMREAAARGGVPVVEITESVAPGSPSFVGWQVAQLDALERALRR